MRKLEIKRSKFRNGAKHLELYVPSPSPNFLHIIRALKQVPSDLDPPSQVFGSCPPLKPGSFPPWTQLKLEANATSYVKSAVLNASPVEFHKE